MNILEAKIIKQPTKSNDFFLEPPSAARIIFCVTSGENIFYRWILSCLQAFIDKTHVIYNSENPIRMLTFFFDNFIVEKKLSNPEFDSTKKLSNWKSRKKRSVSSHLVIPFIHNHLRDKREFPCCKLYFGNFLMDKTH